LAEYNEKLEDLLDHHLIDNEELIKKKETNGIGYLINGNMCLGVYEDLMVARIGKSLAESLVIKPGIHRYLPDKDLYDDFIMIEESICNHSKALQKFIDQSIEYTSQLPPKEDKSGKLNR
jgi:TfoX/Sxy family transcriptional regulator of competence genes